MSHAGTEYARQESAVQFLTDVQERLEVAHVQVELLDALEDLITQSGGLAAFDATFSGAWGGLEPLQSSLLTISEVRYFNGKRATTNDVSNSFTKLMPIRSTCIG